MKGLDNLGLTKHELLLRINRSSRKGLKYHTSLEVMKILLW